MTWQQTEDGKKFYAYINGIQVAGIMGDGVGYKAWVWPLHDAGKHWVDGTFITWYRAKEAIEDVLHVEWS
jgi:hypothetical protein